MFTNSKKIAELQDALAKSTADIESFKAQIAALNEALAAKSKVKKAEDDEDDEDAEDEEEEKEVKKAKAKSKKSEYDEDEEAEDEDEEKETKKGKKAKSKKAEDDEDDEDESVKALKAINAEMTETLKGMSEAFGATVEAAVTSTLAKMGIDPINVAKGNADGTKDKAPKSSNKGLSRAAELLNESLKNKNP